LALWSVVVACAAVVAVGLQASAVVGVSSLVVAAPVLLATISSLRLGLESALALMRIADTLSEIAEHEAVIAVNTSGRADANQQVSGSWSNVNHASSSPPRSSAKDDIP